jgi:hypothetical protein
MLYYSIRGKVSVSVQRKARSICKIRENKESFVWKETAYHRVYVELSIGNYSGGGALIYVPVRMETVSK